MDNLQNTGQQLEVICSLETFNRVQNDPEYRDQLTQSVMEGNTNVPIGSVIFALDDPSAAPQSQKEVEQGGKKEMWLEASTKLLLSLVEELRPQVGKSVRLKNKAKMWQVVTEKINSEGYNFTIKQVEGKFRHLERQYNKTKLNNSLTGRSKKTCPFQSELDNVLVEKRGIYPDFILDSDANDGLAREDLMAADADEDLDTSSSTSRAAAGNVSTAADANEVLDSSPSTSRAADLEEPPKKKPSNLQDKILCKIDSMAKERKMHYEKIAQQKNAFQAKVLEMMQKKEKREEEKCERAKRKEEMAKRMLELLEQLVAKNKN